MEADEFKVHENAVIFYIQKKNIDNHRVLVSSGSPRATLSWMAEDDFIPSDIRR